MTFASPQLLWLLLVPVGLLIFELARRRRTDVVTHAKILRAEAGAHSLKLAPAQSVAPARRSRIHPWLCVGLVFAFAAAARPQWGRLEEPVFDQAREILIAIDLSRSMLTPDVKPSRLDRAKLLTQSLLEKLEGERVGLVVYSGTAFLQSPLSADYEILREFLPALDPEFLPEGGTNYRALIDTAISAFGTTASADRFLIVLSDGEATTDDWRERIPDLKKKAVRVIGLGIGTAEGAMIPDGSGGLVKDERGAVVLSKLESGTLRELADATNGVYQDASNWIDLAGLVSSTVESGKQGEFMEKNTVRIVERFQWPLALALWCLLVSFYYEFPVRPRPRDLKLTSEPAVSKTSTRPNVAALVIFALFACTVFSTNTIAAESTPEPPPLAKIVSRLSTSPQPTARDWAELGRETVTWGSKLQSSQQSVAEGPIRDALTAVDLGSKLDPKTADWPKLREELEAFLKKPDEQDQQKQDEQKKDDEQQNQKQDQEQQNDEQKKDADQKQGDQSQQQKDQSQSGKSEDQKEENKPQADPKEGQQKEDSALGDMKDRKQPPSPPPTEDTQQVGGARKNEKGEETPMDPNLALPLQKLDQLRNQDSPAELFKLLEGEKNTTPRKKTKDW